MENKEHTKKNENTLVYAYKNTGIFINAKPTDSPKMNKTYQMGFRGVIKR